MSERDDLDFNEMLQQIAHLRETGELLNEQQIEGEREFLDTVQAVLDMIEDEDPQEAPAGIDVFLDTSNELLVERLDYIAAWPYGLPEVLVGTIQTGGRISPDLRLGGMRLEAHALYVHVTGALAKLVEVSIDRGWTTNTE